MNAAVVRDARARPQRQLQGGLELEEGDRTMLELRAYDAFGLEAKSIAVETNGTLQVVHAQGDQRNSRLHCRLLRAQTIGAAALLRNIGAGAALPAQPVRNSEVDHQARNATVEAKAMQCFHRSPAATP